MPVMNRSHFLRLGVWIVLAFLVFGRSPAYAQTQEGGDPELGARLYAENCAVCHGATGEGRVGVTLAKNWPSIRPDLQVRTAIANGISGSPMPAWSQENGGPLTDEEIDALTAYILSWQTGGPRPIATLPVTTRPAISPVPDVEGDPNHGAVLYDQNCTVCHGENLEGRIGATLAKNWPSIRPDLGIKNTISNGIEGTPMVAFSQASGGPLNETEINDLVSFILSQEAAAPQAPEAAPISAPAAPGPLAGWGGVLLAVVAFILIVGVALIAQTLR